MMMKPKWKQLAADIVSKQSEGFDWSAYQLRTDQIRTNPGVLHLDAQLRTLHSHFARICLAYVRLAEADLEQARELWRRQAPRSFGTLEFLDADWARSLPESPLYSHLVANGRLGSELWFQIARQIRAAQENGALLDFLKAGPGATETDAPRMTASA
jgi:hypothetical protein